MVCLSAERRTLSLFSFSSPVSISLRFAQMQFGTIQICLEHLYCLHCTWLVYWGQCLAGISAMGSLPLANDVNVCMPGLHANASQKREDGRKRLWSFSLAFKLVSPSQMWRHFKHVESMSSSLKLVFKVPTTAH